MDVRVDRSLRRGSTLVNPGAGCYGPARKTCNAPGNESMIPDLLKLSADEWLFTGMLLVLVYGIGVTPRLADWLAGHKP
jgi:hypothetical protein